MGIFPNFRGENQKCLSCHHPDLLLGFNTRQLLFSFETGSEFLDNWSTESNKKKQNISLAPHAQVGIGQCKSGTCMNIPSRSLTASFLLKSYQTPIGKDSLPTTILRGRAVRLQGYNKKERHVLFGFFWNYISSWNRCLQKQHVPLKHHEWCLGNMVGRMQCESLTSISFPHVSRNIGDVQCIQKRGQIESPPFPMQLCFRLDLLPGTPSHN